MKVPIDEVAVQRTVGNSLYGSLANEYPRDSLYGFAAAK